jgi:hypothetical protein
MVTVSLALDYFRLRRRYLVAIELLQMEANTNEYLLELFNKYDIPVDDFEKLALHYHNINMLPAAEEE